MNRLRPQSPGTRIAAARRAHAGEFMRRHWQRRPLLVRGAMHALRAAAVARELFALAARDDVESRLVRDTARAWSLRHGPLARASLPPLRATAAGPCWCRASTCIDAGAHALLQQFRFVPDARLDDLMISCASDGGGVGAHVDSYDVFLLQARGTAALAHRAAARPRRSTRARR